MITTPSKAGGRKATPKMGRKQIDMPGRYAVSIECADDLTDDELILMLEFFKAELFSLQNHERGDSAERNARFHTWFSL